MHEQTRAIAKTALLALRSRGLDVTINEHGATALTGNTKAIPPADLDSFVSCLKGLKQWIVEIVKEEKANETVGEKTN